MVSYQCYSDSWLAFFTDAYDLFCISTVSKLLGRLYFSDPSSDSQGSSLIVKQSGHGCGFCRHTCCPIGILGWLGDKLGRKKVYGITLILMVICALRSDLSFGSSSSAVIGTLCFFRFWLGFGIRGDYPLSATIMSEYANKKTRGAFIAAVFATQGKGIIFAGLVTMILSGIFSGMYKADPYSKE